MLEVAFLGGVGGLLVVCLSLLVFTLWKLGQYTNPVELASKVRALETELTDLVDRVDTWMRRDATRAARASKEAKRQGEEPGAAADLGSLDPASRKAVLRGLVAQRMRR